LSPHEFNGQGKNSEFVNHGAGLPEWSHKNEKDCPPIHSDEQSLQITPSNVMELNPAI
jgi:hypothetical protein